MLFRRKMEKSCYYCAHGVQMNDDRIVCSKKGFIDGDKPCRRFSYDPLKRIPPRMKVVDFSKYENEDFSL